MERYTESWTSAALDAKMEVVVYGHYGPAVLFFSREGEDLGALEREELIHRCAPLLDAGRLKIVTIDSPDSETWLSSMVPNKKKAQRHQQFNRYLTEEVVPFIGRNLRSSHPTIFTCGISMGALHAVNSFLRRPDLFQGTFGFSGTYDLKHWTKGYDDKDVYFNSPIDYLENLTGPALTNLRQKNRVLLVAGSGAGEHPEASQALAELMGRKGIPNWVDIWGEDFSHDWDAWRVMIPTIFERNF
ncbi:MAG TPA: alpha/beta hydrolase-fold protein [Candidatus Kapabacteria bacterium]|jgi:esterase/lipase superfamily enzyme